MSIQIAQISDCHLPANPRHSYRGINPYRNLKALLKKAKTLKPDLILATGDLSEDGSAESYRLIQDLFDPLGVPVLALPGNHDAPALLADTYPGSPVDSIQATRHGNWQIIRLNSCIPDNPCGRLSQKTLSELESVLAQNADQPKLLAVHHQPVTVGSPWIDKYCMLEPAPFLRVVDQYEAIKAVVWGHIHQVFESSKNGTTMLGSPSSAINGIPGAEKFTPDTLGPACRWLELHADGSLQSHIVSV
jgi:Icc protein